MYPVSSDFQEAVIASERWIKGKVIIDYTDWLIDQSVLVTVNEEANTSYKKHVLDGVLNPYAKYISLDGLWELGDDYGLSPGILEEAHRQMGWWGSTLSGVGGSFSSPYPKLTVEHFGRPVYQLRVSGDSKRAEYPRDFTVILYGEGDTVLYTKTVTDNTLIHWSFDLIEHITGVVKQELTITKWSHAGRQVKIAEFFTSIQHTYESNDLAGVYLLEEREIGSGTIPIGAISSNEIVIKLNNEDRKFDSDNVDSPLYQMLKPNRRIRPFLGVLINDTVEMVPLGVFWSTEWNVPEDGVLASVIGRDRLELLRKTTFQSSYVLQNKSLYEIAEIVLEDAKVSPSTYEIHPSLDDIIIPYAWFAPVSHREALRIIAEAAMATVYADREGKIIIQPFAMETISPVLDIGPNQYFKSDNPLKYGEVANEIIVKTQPLLPDATASEVYRSNEPENIGGGQTVSLTLYYNIPPVIEPSISLEGAVYTSIQEVSYFGWGVNLVLENTGGSAENVTVVITGKPLRILNAQQVVSRDEDSIIDLGEIRFELTNPLVQTRSIAEQLADLILASTSQSKRDIDMEWKGNPALELGDKITVKDGDFYVIRNELDWAGALRAKLMGRRA